MRRVCFLFKCDFIPMDKNQNSTSIPQTILKKIVNTEEIFLDGIGNIWD